MTRDEFSWMMQQLVEETGFGMFVFHEGDPTLSYLPASEDSELPPISDDSIDTQALTWSDKEISELLGLPAATGLGLLTLQAATGHLTAYILWICDEGIDIGLRRLLLTNLDQGKETSWAKRGTFQYTPTDLLAFIMERKHRQYRTFRVEEKFIKSILRASRGFVCPSCSRRKGLLLRISNRILSSLFHDHPSWRRLREKRFYASGRAASKARHS